MKSQRTGFNNLIGTSLPDHVRKHHHAVPLQWRNQLEALCVCCLGTRRFGRVCDGASEPAGGGCLWMCGCGLGFSHVDNLLALRESRSSKQFTTIVLLNEKSFPIVSGEAEIIIHKSIESTQR